MSKPVYQRGAIAIGGGSIGSSASIATQLENPELQVATAGLGIVAALIAYGLECLKHIAEARSGRATYTDALGDLIQSTLKLQTGLKGIHDDSTPNDIPDEVLSR